MVTRAIFGQKMSEKQKNKANENLDDVAKYFIEFFGEEYREDILRKINNATYVFAHKPTKKYQRAKFLYSTAIKAMQKAFPNTPIDNELFETLLNFIFTDRKFLGVTDSINAKKALAKLLGEDQSFIDLNNLDDELENKFSKIKQTIENAMRAFDQKQESKLGQQALSNYLFAQTGHTLTDTSTYAFMCGDYAATAFVSQLQTGEVDGRLTYHSIATFDSNPTNTTVVHELLHVVSNDDYSVISGLNHKTDYFNECLTQFMATKINGKMKSAHVGRKRQLGESCIYELAFPLLEDFFEKNLDALKKMYISNNDMALEDHFGPSIRNLQYNLESLFAWCGKQGYKKQDIIDYLKGKKLFLGYLKKDEQLNFKIRDIKQSLKEIEEFLKQRNLEQ